MSYSKLRLKDEDAMNKAKELGFETELKDGKYYLCIENPCHKSKMDVLKQNLDELNIHMEANEEVEVLVYQYQFN